MFVSTAYAQAAGGGGGSDFLLQMMPLLLIFVIFWFFLIRPQQRKAKEHRVMVSNLKRNDQVLTEGGIIGKVTKLLDETMVQVEIADKVRVRVARAKISEVMSRTQPASAKPDSKKDDEAEAKDDGAKTDGAKASGEKKSIFSFGQKK